MTILRIRHPNLKDESISYGFFTRNGGVSKPPFDSLNCSYNVNDNKNDVKKNLELVNQELKLNKIIKLNQIHSSNAIIINNENKHHNVLSADGLVTNLPGLGLSILGADCAPILFYDRITKTIGACHAGWRGAIGEIVESTILNMESIGSNRDNILAVIGPTIQKQSYEIKEDVAKSIKNSPCFKINNSILTHMEDDRYLFDLPLLLKEKLKKSKIGKISDVNLDTYDINNSFFSYRNSTHKNPLNTGVTGRHISVIGILK